jgi:hypothetical protein
MSTNLSPDQIAEYIGLADSLYQLIVNHLKARGVSDEQIAAVSDDYRARSARREAEAK